MLSRVLFERIQIQTFRHLYKRPKFQSVLEAFFFYDNLVLSTQSFPLHTFILDIMFPHSNSSSRFFCLFSKKNMSRSNSRTSILPEDDTSKSGSSSSSSGRVNQWYYCDLCKVGFASQSRHHWHTDLCNHSTTSVNSYDSQTIITHIYTMKNIKDLSSARNNVFL